MTAAIQDKHLAVLEAFKKPGNGDKIRALLADPDIDISAPIPTAANQRNLWEGLVYNDYTSESKQEYFEILLDKGQQVKPSSISNTADCIGRLAELSLPKTLGRLLTALEEAEVDISSIKSGKTTGKLTRDMPMGAAARADDLETMHVLKAHEFSVDAPKASKGDEGAAYPPILTASASGKGTDGFFQLIEWGAAIDAVDAMGENVYYSTLRSNAPLTHVALPIIRYAMAENVPLRNRMNNSADDKAFNYPLNATLGRRNIAVTEMFIAAGVDPCEEANRLEQAIKFYQKPSGMAMRSYKYEIAFAENTVKAYTRLPKKPPQDLTGLTRAKLEEENESGLSLLDHPQTWFRFKTVQAELAKNGEAFTPDELRQGSMRPSGRSFLAAIVGYHGPEVVQEYLEAQGDTIRITDLLDKKNEPTTFYATIIDFGALPRLFTEEIWFDKTASELSRAYNVLDDAQKAQIPNYHQLSSTLSRSSGRARG